MRGRRVKETYPKVEKLGGLLESSDVISFPSEKHYLQRLFYCSSSVAPP